MGVDRGGRRGATSRNGVRGGADTLYGGGGMGSAEAPGGSSEEGLTRAQPDVRPPRRRRYSRLRCLAGAESGRRGFPSRRHGLRPRFGVSRWAAGGDELVETSVAIGWEARGG